MQPGPGAGNNSYGYHSREPAKTLILTFNDTTHNSEGVMAVTHAGNINLFISSNPTTDPTVHEFGFTRLDSLVVHYK